MTRPQPGDDPAFVRALRIMVEQRAAAQRLAKGWGK